MNLYVLSCYNDNNNDNNNNNNNNNFETTIVSNKTHSVITVLNYTHEAV